MRLLLALAALAAMTVAGFAQTTTQELTATNTIRLHPGDSKLFELSKPYNKFHLTDDGIVQVVVDTDQRYVLRALKPGRVLMSIYGEGDRLIQRSEVVVAGGLVRMYGTSTADEKKADYVGYICSETGCGRADPEVDQPETRTTVQRTRRNSRGDIITTTRGN